MDDQTTNITSLIASLTTLVTFITSLLIFFILILQTDRFRRLVFSAPRLRRVRRNEQRHALECEIANRIQSIRRLVNEGEDFESDAERCITDVIIEDGKVDELVSEILRNGAFGDSGHGVRMENDEKTRLDTSIPIIVGISLDLSPKSFANNQEWFLYLAYPQLNRSTNQISYAKRVKTPLINFAIKLAAALRTVQKRTSVNTEFSPIIDNYDSKLCFVMDASSGLGTTILASFLKKYSAATVLVEEPAWMTSLSYLIQTKAFDSYTRDTVVNMIYGLCRLQVSASRQMHYFSSNASSNTTVVTSDKLKSVIVTLPGQSCTDVLLPILYQAFPRSHFLFSYDTCINSVELGLSLPTLADDPSSNGERVKSTPQKISASIPISLVKKQDVEGFDERLAGIPAGEAGLVEAWVTSVVSFLSLEAKVGREKDGVETKENKGGSTAKTFPSLSTINVRKLVNKTYAPTSTEEGTELLKVLSLSKQTNSDLRVLSQIASDLITKSTSSQKKLTEEEHRAIDRCVGVHDIIWHDKLKRFL